MNTRRHWIFSLLLAASAVAAQAAPSPALDDPNTVVTVMEFTAKDPAQRAELAKRMTAMRDHIRKQPGYIDNAVMQNRNPGNKPDYVGVTRWKSFKDWENMWLKEDMQKLVRAVVEVGDLRPNTFSPIKP